MENISRTIPFTYIPFKTYIYPSNNFEPMFYVYEQMICKIMFLKLTSKLYFLYGKVEFVNKVESVLISFK